MDVQTLLNIAFGVAGAMCMWVLNSLKDSLKSLHDSDEALTEKVQKIELLVTGVYVKKDEMDRIAAAVASGALKLPAGVRPETLNDAAYMPPSMPWIDPKKEAEAWGLLEDRCYVSGPEIIRKRGGNPIDTLEQQSRWVREKKRARHSGQCGGGAAGCDGHRVEPAHAHTAPHPNLEPAGTTP
jgi:hypothetical protein